MNDKYEELRKNPKVFEEFFDKISVDSGNHYQTEEQRKQYREERKYIHNIFPEKIPNVEPYSKQWVFENGFGVSVIRNYGSYGYEDNLFEVAVLKVLDEEFENGNITVDNAHLCYKTTITEDVVPHSDSYEVKSIGERVKDFDKVR